jgi:hypothetical protein
LAHNNGAHVGFFQPVAQAGLGEPAVPVVQNRAFKGRGEGFEQGIDGHKGETRKDQGGKRNEEQKRAKSTDSQIAARHSWFRRGVFLVCGAKVVHKVHHEPVHCAPKVRSQRRVSGVKLGKIDSVHFAVRGRNYNAICT